MELDREGLEKARAARRLAAKTLTKVCRACRGSGVIVADRGDGHGPGGVECAKCDGGVIDPTEDALDEAFLRAYLAGGPSVPAGWKLVPEEPTAEMRKRAFGAMRLDPSCGPFSQRIWLKGWDAALLAAPPPAAPQAQAEGAGRDGE